MVTTISPELLRLRLREDGLTLIDTRPEESFEAWHIPGAVNFPYSTDDDSVDVPALEEHTGVSPGDDIATICAKGISSYDFARALEEHGHEEVSVAQDGMEGWSQLYELVSIPTVATSLEIFQIQRVAKGCLGYVIGSPTAREAIVVDPTRHTDEFTRVAADDDMEITHVIDTHIHADHISGGPAIAEETGATYHLPSGALDREIDLEFVPLERNDVLTLGEIDLKAIHTPGHTAEAISLLVGAEAVLTADTLFTDGVGRTELQFGEANAEAGARSLFHSIHGSLLTLPDGVSILPGHFASEDPGVLGDVDDPIMTTVQDARTELPLLQLEEEDFVDRVTASIPEKPPNYDRMMAINTGREPPEDESEATELELGPNRCAAAAD